MQYLLNKNGRYYFNRRVPKSFKEYDPRPMVRIALNTDSKKEAIRLAVVHSDELEAYWKSLLGSGLKHSHAIYQDAVNRAKTYGFSYLDCKKLAGASLEEITKRLLFIEHNNFNKHQVESVLGGLEKPAVNVSEALEKYWEFAKEKFINKSPTQLRKYKTPRIRAIRNFINVVGDKSLTELTRDDILKFKDWWLTKIKKENLSFDSLNKNTIQLKVIIETCSDNMKLDIDIEHLFKNLTVKDRFTKTRLPFETKFLVEKLLRHDVLEGLPEQARWFLFAMAETGCRSVELCGLLPCDIKLDDPIPHIHICDRPERPLKTPQSDRKIPLVGFALDAFKACPNGFTDYFDNYDYLSSLFSIYFREKKLMPSESHSVYSLRHSFQDRILRVDAPDRIQAELMGHKFNRPSYGLGGEMEHKLEWMRKVQLKGQFITQHE